MAELPHGCTVFKVDDSKYSSFVPIIGMYIAGISLVCFLAISYDVISVFRHKKTWLPCQLFSLNSVTLTLLGVAAKIPVDLTTSMPTRLDQFSKLTGTSLICISMGFLMPSLGATPKSETLSNMWALSIFVVTVVVNICMQIRTGVIFLLIPEHIIIMCFMLAMLIVLWFCSETVADEKPYRLDYDKYEFRESGGTLLQRLRFAYLRGFNHNPQFLLWTDNQIYTVAGLCIACSVVMVEAAIRNLSLEFCGGSSDYGWSVWVIVLVQISVVAIGSFATIYRCLGSSTRQMIFWTHKFKTSDVRFEILETKGSFLRMNRRDWCIILMKVVVLYVSGLLYMLVCVPLTKISEYIGTVFGFLFRRKHEEDSDVLEHKHKVELFEDWVKQGWVTSAEDRERWLDLFGDASVWGLVKSVQDMKRWMTKTGSKSVKKLSELLERAGPSREFHNMQLSDEYWQIEDITATSLAVALLVRIAQIVLSSQYGDPLVQAHAEVYEIVHFVEDRVKLSVAGRNISKFAEAVRMGSCTKRNGLEQSQLHSLENLDKEFPEGLAWFEAQSIIAYIQDHRTSSTERALYECIQQLFVDMLHMFLTQLPHAIYREVTESSAEDFYECVKRSLGILWKIRSLETQVHWSFPRGFHEGCGLITPSRVDPEEAQVHWSFPRTWSSLNR